MPLTIVDTVVFIVSMFLIASYILRDILAVNINLRHIYVPPPGTARYQRARTDHQIKIAQALCEITVLLHNISFIDQLLAHVNTDPEIEAQYLFVRDLLGIRIRSVERYLEGLVQAAPFLDPSFF